MVNTDKLKEHMASRGVTVEKLSRKIGMDDSTFYRKLSAQGKTFTLEQADAIKRELNLDKETAEAIFFS